MSKPDFNTYGKTMAELRAAWFSADIDKYKGALQMIIERDRLHAELEKAR